jgi:hypothetical protein
MKRLTAFLTAGFLIGLISASGAQPYPANGYVGVYQDAAGTICCSTVAPGSPVTLHVIAHLAGGSSPGITGAEFRLEFSSVASYFFTWAPNPAAAGSSIGNPIDDTPADPLDAKGVNVAFPTCQGEPPAAPLVELGTITAFNLGGGPVTILTKKKSPPSNPTKLTPLFVLCDAPNFSTVPMTIDETQNNNIETIAFKSQINATCDGSCGPVPVEPKSWSAVKSLYN